jgi:3-methyl-2-oxobutanoate hydroxymethyltransferase
MSAHTKVKRMTAPKIRALKGERPVVCLTAYTTPIAQILDPHMDLILVGDSVGMVLHGMKNTLGVTMEMMIMHGASVVRGTKHACVIVDMPFASYQESPELAYRNAARLMKETGCAGIKLEGGVEMAETIRFLTERGIPVMGHIGLTPQSFNSLGGYSARGRKQEQWAPIIADGIAVDGAGAFSTVVEGVAQPLAEEITGKVGTVTIGIGASPACDGQILVTEDLLGLYERVPPFAKQYAHIRTDVEEAAKCYAAEVHARTFPGPEHCYKMSDGEK